MEPILLGLIAPLAKPGFGMSTCMMQPTSGSDFAGPVIFVIIDMVAGDYSGLQIQEAGSRELPSANAGRGLPSPLPLSLTPQGGKQAERRGEA